MSPKFIVFVFCVLPAIELICIGANGKVLSVNGNCDTVCACQQTSDNMEGIEFNAICKGDGSQGVILDETLFAEEPVPDWTRRVYVRVENFTSVLVRDGFLARWLAYTSCSFDIWSSDNISFPKQAPPHAETNAFQFVFAGVGLSQSSIDEFPTGLFDGKSTVGLNIVNSRLNHLNLFDLNPKSLNYLKIRNSIVKSIEGRPGKSIDPEESLSNGSPVINIQNSQIGFMGENALSLSNYDGIGKAVINIKSSVIGIIQKSAVQTGRGIEMNIVGSVLGFVAPFVFSFHPGTNVSLTENILGLEKASMSNLTCRSSFQIANNVILPRHLSDCLFQFHGDELKLATCEGEVKVSEYVDASCTGNRMMSSGTNLGPHLPKLSSSASQNSSANESYNESTPFTYLASASMSHNQVSIPTGLFYLVLGLCFFLIVVVVTLIALSIWGKMSKERKLSTSSRTHVESIYESPNAYFAPGAPSLQSTYGKDIECDRYQFGTLGSKKIECVDGDDTVYLNMK